MDTKTIFYIICGITIVIMLIYYVKRDNTFSSLLFGSLSGFIALLLLNKYGTFLEVIPPLNLFNTVGSIVLGVPYVIAIVIIEKI